MNTMSDTPLTDKAEYEVRLGKHRRMVVRPGLCRAFERLSAEAERQRDAYAETLREFLREADDFAERRRDYLRFLRLADEIDERHPELAGNAGADLPPPATPESKESHPGG